MTRAAAIIVDAGRVALIERRNDRGVYYVFPGGTLEEGETPPETAAREVHEELGLRVEVGALVAEVTFQDEMQSYFLVRVVGGTFGSGNGEEIVGPVRPERGSYTPVWLAIRDIAVRPVFPGAVAALVAQAIEDGWPREPLRYVEA